MSAVNTLKNVATGNQPPAEARNPVANFKAILEKRRNEITAALPKHLSADRMIRLACTEFAKNPKLAECTPVSVYGSIIQAAQLGIEIGVMGQGYLVPFQKSTKQGDRWIKSLECQFIPGYKGLIGLARRSGEVTSIETHIVFANDKFSLKLGLDTQLEHEPLLDGDRGPMRLVYGVAKFRDGGHHFEWMTMGDIMKIKAQSKAGTAGPWVEHFEQMARKTLIRRMANYLPMSIELDAALKIDAAAESGRTVHTEKTIEGDVFVTVDEDGVIGEAAPQGQDAQPEGKAGEQIQQEPQGKTRTRNKEAAPEQQQEAGNGASTAPFSLQDALAMVANGEYAQARDLVRSAPFTDIDRQAVEAEIEQRTAQLRGDAVGDARPTPPDAA